jgi:hypothetical protein
MSRRLIAVVALLAAVPAASGGEWTSPGLTGAVFAARQDVPPVGHMREESDAYRAGYAVGTILVGVLFLAGGVWVIYRMGKNPYAEPPRGRGGRRPRYDDEDF